MGEADGVARRHSEGDGAMRRIRVHEAGGPEVMRLEEWTAAAPGEGEALVRIEAAGVNFIEVYHRIGFYPMPLPFTPGQEAAGVVEAVGAGVTHVKLGDRVAYGGTIGSYSERRLIAADKLLGACPTADRPTARRPRLTLEGIDRGGPCLRRGFSRSPGAIRYSFMPPPAAWARSPANGLRGAWRAR